MFYILFISYIGLHADYVNIIKMHLPKSCVGILNSLLKLKIKLKQIFFYFSINKTGTNYSSKIAVLFRI